MLRRESLERLVAKYFPDALLTAFEPLTGGVSADVTRLDISAPDGQTFSVVLREHGATHDGNELALEFATLQAIHKAGLAVPKPLACDDTGELLQYPWLLMEFVEGSTNIPQEEASDRIVGMAKHLHAISKTPVDQLSALPTATDPRPELLEWMPMGDFWDDLRAALADIECTQYSGQCVLVHGDFWPQNIIWDEGARIRAVIDWEDACLGDPNADVAFTCLELRYIYGQKGAELFKKAYSQFRTIDPLRFALWQAYAATHAYQRMGNWRLEPEREKTMRAAAVATIKEATRMIAK